MDEDRYDEIAARLTKVKKVQCQPKASKFSVKFHKFLEIPDSDVFAKSSRFTCFGNEWRVSLSPYSDYQRVAVYLERTNNRSTKFPDVKILFEVKSIDGLVSIQATPSESRYYPSKDCSGLCTLSSRSDIKRRFLQGGALTIYVTMELKELIPANPLAPTMLKLFQDQESSDVIFEVVKSDDSANKQKRGKSSVLFYAHRFILEHTSPEVAALCESSPEKGMDSPILINDIKAGIFRHILYYIYGGNISQEYFIANAKSLIDAADKYGVVNLKLEAEVWYVHSTRITTDNVIDNLLYADAKNLALLKEAVMDYIVKNRRKVIKRVSFKEVPGDIYKDLLAAMSRVLDDSDEDDSDDEEEGNEEDYASMGIGALRRKLDANGKDIDGSRDVLIAALKKH